MRKLFLIFLIPFLIACTSTEYRKNLQANDYLFEPKYSIKNSSTADSDYEGIALSVGKDKTGFIAPDRTASRLLFEEKYPIKNATEKDLSNLTSSFHQIKVGQVLVLSADLDERTSGFLKNEKNEPISLSGRFEVNSDQMISQGAIAGATSGVVSSSLSVVTTNSQLAKSGLQLSSSGQNSLMISGLVGGLVVGSVVGAIDANNKTKALNGIINSTTFGERISFAHNVLHSESAGPISHDGFGGSPFNNVEPVKINNGIVKRVFIYKGKLNNTYQRDLFIISTVATYRGEHYANEHPNSLGWEYRITNLNLIKISSGIEDEYELRFRAIKSALEKNNYQL